MSDTTNRDLGRKREYKSHHRYCDCWHCTDGATKKREKKQKRDRDDMKQIKRELGYSRIGMDNV